MAKDDPESSLAEDRAFECWHADTTSDEAETFFRICDPNKQLEHVYRQGFRAGREHPKRPWRRVYVSVEAFDRLNNQVIGMAADVEALANERARNITALVEENQALKRRLDALEHEKRVLFHNAGVETGIREDIGRRVVALEERLGIDAAEERAEREDRLREEVAHCDRINASTSTLPNPEDEL